MIPIGFPDRKTNDRSEMRKSIAPRDEIPSRENVFRILIVDSISLYIQVCVGVGGWVSNNDKFPEIIATPILFALSKYFSALSFFSSFF